MMEARQSTPMETSFPCSLVRPLWQAMQRSAVWKAVTGELSSVPPRTGTQVANSTDSTAIIQINGFVTIP